MTNNTGWPLQSTVEHNTPLTVVAIFPSGKPPSTSILADNINREAPFYLVNARTEMFNELNIKNFDTSVLGVVVQKRVNGLGQNGFTIYLVSREDSAGYTWDQKILANDIVVVMMQRPKIDKSLQTVMVGLVKSVKRTTELSGNPDLPTVSRNIEITGLDMTSWLMRHQIFSDLSFLSINVAFANILPSTKDKIKPQNGQTVSTVSPQLWPMLIWKNVDAYASVDTMIKQIMQEYVTKDMTLVNTIPSLDNKPLSEMLKIDEQSTSFYVEEGTVTSESFKIHTLAYTNTRGSIGEFFLDILQRPCNEITVTYSFDHLTGKNPVCTMHIRPAPYKYDKSQILDGLSETTGDIGAPITDGSEKSFFQDPTKMSYEYSKLDVPLTTPDGIQWTASIHAIDDLDVIREELGIEDENSPNVFLVAAKNSKAALGIMPELNTTPQGDSSYITRFGFVPLIQLFDYVGTGSAPAEDPNADVLAFKEPMRTFADTLSSTLKHWFVRTPDFKKGTINIKGRASIKEGDILVYKSNEMKTTYLFYIEAVTQTFINFNKFYTLLEVARGVRI